jgi:hypothetical protein
MWTRSKKCSVLRTKSVKQRAMKKAWLAMAIALFCSASAIADAGVPRWTFVIYAGTDEEELAEYTDPIIESLITATLPENVELLIEQDTAGPGGVRRILRRGKAKPIIQELPEHDSASEERILDFLSWVKSQSSGVYSVFTVMTHSWGWKGMIQDFELPGHPGEDTMMPLRVFSRALKDSGARFDVVFLDSCVLGNVEAVQELKTSARYLVASQRETPFNGIPYIPLLRSLADARLTPRALASEIPARYVAPYLRRGSLASTEGEYDVITVTALDLAKWQPFVAEFRKLVEALRAGGFRQRLAENPAWPKYWTDPDSNIDLIQLLNELSQSDLGDAVRMQSSALLAQIGYPKAALKLGTSTFQLDPKSHQRFELLIQADELMTTKEPSELLPKMKSKWEAINQDLDLPKDLEIDIIQSKSRGNPVRTLRIRGPVLHAIELRPWLPGTRKALLKVQDVQGQWAEKKLSEKSDGVFVRSFPRSSFILSEAHSFGAPFVHGLGINLNPLMDENEERASDPFNGLAGPALYRSGAWNQATGWGDLILLK